jgi:K+-transporting ATPase KdpF subunit
VARRPHGGAVRGTRRARPGGRTLMALNVIGGIVAVLLAGFVVAALLFPEKF